MTAVGLGLPWFDPYSYNVPIARIWCLTSPKQSDHLFDVTSRAIVRAFIRTPRDVFSVTLPKPFPPDKESYSENTPLTTSLDPTFVSFREPGVNVSVRKETTQLPKSSEKDIIAAGLEFKTKYFEANCSIEETLLREVMPPHFPTVLLWLVINYIKTLPTVIVDHLAALFPQHPLVLRLLLSYSDFGGPLGTTRGIYLYFSNSYSTTESTADASDWCERHLPFMMSYLCSMKGVPWTTGDASDHPYPLTRGYPQVRSQYQSFNRWFKLKVRPILCSSVTPLNRYAAHCTIESITTTFCRIVAAAMHSFRDCLNSEPGWFFKGDILADWSDWTIAINCPVDIRSRISSSPVSRHLFILRTAITNRFFKAVDLLDTLLMIDADCVEHTLSHLEAWRIFPRHLLEHKQTFIHLVKRMPSGTFLVFSLPNGSQVSVWHPFLTTHQVIFFVNATSL